MNFLNKARRKVEEAVNEVRNSQTGQPQPQHGYPNQQPQYSPPAQQWSPHANQTPYQAPYQVPTQQPGSIPIHPNPAGSFQQQFFPPPQPQPHGVPVPTPYVGEIPQQQYYSPPTIHSPAPYVEPRQLLGGTPHQQQISPVGTSQAPLNDSTNYPPPPSSSFNTLQSPQQHSAVSPQVPISMASQNSLKCLGDPAVLPKYTQFFVLKASDNFAVCKNCFQSKVAPHQGLIYEFKPYHTTSDELRFLCDFSYPRTKAVFRNQCVPQNTVQPLLDFVKLSETLTPCDGSVISAPGPFYEAKDEAIPGLAVCPTCFETNLRHTVFEDKFRTVPDGSHGGTNQWACDMAMPYYQRLLKHALQQDIPDFAKFAEEATARLAIPACPGEGKAITQFCSDTPVISTAQGGKTGNICLACYCDYVSNTSLDEAFGPATLSEEQLGKVTCDLSSPYSKTAMDLAARRGNDEIWRAAVGVAGKVGQCQGSRGVDAEQLVNERSQIGDLANWYQLNGTPSIEICPNCYWLKTKLLGADHLFSEITSNLPAGKVLQCYMSDSKLPENMSTSNPDDFESSMAWRGRRIFNSLLPGSEVGNWTVLQTVAQDVAKGPPPCGGQTRGFKRASERRWFGRVNPDASNLDDCTIAFCEECHSHTVKGTPHEAHYSNDLTEDAYAAEGPTGFVCQTYTNRARAILREAAQAGDLIRFAQFWNLRSELRKKRDAWKPIIEAQLLRTQMANFQQSQDILLKVNAQANALSQIGSAGIVEAAMSDPGERYGNSQIGNDFWTRGRAEAEQNWQNASNMQVGSGAGSMGLMGETQRIFLMAQQDENAFAAVE